MTRLDDAARRDFLSKQPEWAVDGEMLRRRFELSDFPAAIAFVVQVAFSAEAADHHPDIDIRWNKVTIALTTHEAGALTAKDTDLANEISALAG
ncbi:MAG TPA: 4a-hydroxytetrahydrobiopterin dehydratase [Acidimicrobiia bacterium]|jgi:4a-hydroxytetrahydrobiopterin dehydratase|nr:4a-hydroxytetrahydrobiopterin dehydratase [Acidimicrobiia bacterium]